MKMQKFLLSVVALMMAMSANAQKYLNDSDTPFGKGKVYIEASLSSLDLSSQAKQFHFGVNGRGGYLFMDNLMALAELNYNHLEDQNDTFGIGAGARYYIIQNGLYLGAMLKFKHRSDKENDFMPGLHLGYAFFLSRTVTIEPELYFDFSTKKFEQSNYGLGVGFGVYL
jgi:hypothetical protein